jgi:glycosyltransferase involved in cell wall biosynthesis
LFFGVWLFSLKVKRSIRRMLQGIPQKAPTDQVKPLRILVVGQTPPPFCGQTVMIKLLLDGFYRDIELIHVRMHFSKKLGSTGRFKLVKVLELLRVIADIYYLRLTKRPAVIYYPPAGPSFVPIVRDIVILGMTRWLFKATAFHFHAGGAAEYSLRMNPVVRLIYRSALAKPDLAIRTSKRAPQDGRWTHCKKEVVVPNGIPDYAGKVTQRVLVPGVPVKLLLVSFLREDKGVLVAIQAAQELMSAGMDIELTCVGEWDSEGLRARAESMIDAKFKSRFKFPGMLTGSEKWDYYRESDIALFPSYFHSETFGIVLLEAMCFSLPVVATRWRGIPDVVVEGNCAILCEPRDVAGCRDAIALLANDPALRNQMGQRGRERFLRYFTLEAHRKAMEAALSQLRG